MHIAIETNVLSCCYKGICRGEVIRIEADEESLEFGKSGNAAINGVGIKMDVIIQVEEKFDNIFVEKGYGKFGVIPIFTLSSSVHRVSPVLLYSSGAGWLFL